MSDPRSELRLIRLRTEFTYWPEVHRPIAIRKPDFVLCYICYMHWCLDTWSGGGMLVTGSPRYLFVLILELKLKILASSELGA